MRLQVSAHLSGSKIPRLGVTPPCLCPVIKATMAPGCPELLTPLRISNEASSSTGVPGTSLESSGLLCEQGEGRDTGRP